jgi:Trk K+ transport system NAD-binding subunit
VLIISGEKQGQNIADRLLSKDEYQMMFRSAIHQVTFIEEDEAICKELEQRYNVPIYQGDGTKKELLGQVGIDNIDVVIAAFEDDGRNVIAALQAKQLNLEKVIAIVQNHEYTQLLEQNNQVIQSHLIRNPTITKTSHKKRHFANHFHTSFISLILSAIAKRLLYNCLIRLHKACAT